MRRPAVQSSIIFPPIILVSMTDKWWNFSVVDSWFLLNLNKSDPSYVKHTINVWQFSLINISKTLMSSKIKFVQIYCQALISCPSWSKNTKKGSVYPSTLFSKSITNFLSFCNAWHADLADFSLFMTSHKGSGDNLTTDFYFFKIKCFLVF